jgi:hypothetical protein
MRFAGRLRRWQKFKMIKILQAAPAREQQKYYFPAFAPTFNFAFIANLSANMFQIHIHGLRSAGADRGR